MKMGCPKLTYHEILPTLKVAYSSILEGSEPCTSFFSFTRKSSAGEYRYSFNGMEKDDEVKGNGNQLDYGARMYDSRLGRWLSIDPLAIKYPFASPYNMSLNNPILFKDYDGRDIIITNNGESFTFSTGNNSYSGSNEFIRETVSGLNYLLAYEAISDAKFKVITDLSSNKDVLAKVAKIGLTVHPYAAGGATWNPKQGTLVKNNKTGDVEIQSPIGTLLHELGHEYQEMLQYYGILNEELPFNPTSEQIDDYEKRSQSSPFDNFGEEGVITNLENNFYEYYGQAPRGDHDVYGFVEVKGDYTSNEACMTCGTLDAGKEVVINEEK
jgi:RHS repeat-associated protein